MVELPFPAVPCTECGRLPTDHSGSDHRYHAVIRGSFEVQLVGREAPVASPVPELERKPRVPGIEGEPIFLARDDADRMLCPACGAPGIRGVIPPLGQLARREAVLSCACGWSCANVGRMVLVPNDVSTLTG